jgi:hypothetical protein
LKLFSCVNLLCGPLKRSFYSLFKLANSCQKNSNLHTNSLKKLLIMNEKCYNCVKKWHATSLFLTENACKNEPLWHFFNASWAIQKSHILWTQMNEKTCAFNNWHQKIVFCMYLFLKIWSKQIVISTIRRPN